MIENLMGLRLIDINNGNTGTITEAGGPCCEFNERDKDNPWVNIDFDNGEGFACGFLNTLLTHWRFIED